MSRVLASLTAFTTKVILFEKVPAASVILKTKFPMLVISLFAFSLGVNINPSRSVVDNVSPTVKRVPSASAIVPPVGRDSTEIERLSPSTSVTETLNEPATSSVKVNELTSKTGSSFTADVAFTLDNGTDVGQIKIIACSGMASSYDADITVSSWHDSGAASPQITLDAAGEAVICIWTGSVWLPVAEAGGATVVNS